LDIDTDQSSPAGADTGDDVVLVERIDVDSHGAQLALMTLNRPHQRNPLTHEVFLEIGRLAAEFDQDADVRAVAIIGTGPAFSAGGDPRRTPSYNAMCPGSRRSSKMSIGCSPA
jgi:enoyl-CoA hydratase/carnithine racemase